MLWCAMDHRVFQFPPDGSAYKEKKLDCFEQNHAFCFKLQCASIVVLLCTAIWWKSKDAVVHCEKSDHETAIVQWIRLESNVLRLWVRILTGHIADSQLFLRKKWFFENLAIPGLFFVYFRIFNAVDITYKFCRWLDSNHQSLMFEATALPTTPQPQPKKKWFYK